MDQFTFIHHMYIYFRKCIHQESNHNHYAMDFFYVNVCIVYVHLIGQNHKIIQRTRIRTSIIYVLHSYWWTSYTFYQQLTIWIMDGHFPSEAMCNEALCPHLMPQNALSCSKLHYYVRVSVIGQKKSTKIIYITLHFTYILNTRHLYSNKINQFS